MVVNPNRQMACPQYEMQGSVSLGGLATFNMLNGFSESLVRGMRSGFLADSDYHHMSQCETLEVRRVCLRFSNRAFLCVVCVSDLFLCSPSPFPNTRRM